MPQQRRDRGGLSKGEKLGSSAVKYHTSPNAGELGNRAKITHSLTLTYERPTPGPAEQGRLVLGDLTGWGSAPPAHLAPPSQPKRRNRERV